jgi:rubrerythrin
MFTIADICDIAVQIERNGETTYRKAARKIENETVGDILNRMADEEHQHAKWFSKLDDDRSATSPQDELESMGRTLLREMVKDKTFSLDAGELSKVNNLRAFFEQSITFERDTIIFYEMLQEFIDDETVRAKLDRIVAQEREHINQIKELMALYI